MRFHIKNPDRRTQIPHQQHIQKLLSPVQERSNRQPQRFPTRTG